MGEDAPKQSWSSQLKILHLLLIFLHWASLAPHHPFKLLPKFNRDFIMLKQNYLSISKPETLIAHPTKVSQCSNHVCLQSRDIFQRNVAQEESSGVTHPWEMGLLLPCQHLQHPICIGTSPRSLSACPKETQRKIRASSSLGKIKQSWMLVTAVHPWAGMLMRLFSQHHPANIQKKLGLVPEFFSCFWSQWTLMCGQ